MENTERTFKRIEAEVKDDCNILITTIDNAGVKLTENHEFEPDCTLTETDKLALALLIILGFDPDKVRLCGILESWVDDDEDNDFMEFYNEEKAKEKADSLLTAAKEALRKEKEEADKMRSEKGVK